MQKLFFFVKEWPKNLGVVNLLVETQFHFMGASVLRNRICYLLFWRKFVSFLTDLFVTKYLVFLKVRFICTIL